VIRRRWLRGAFVVWVVALAASHAVRLARRDAPPPLAPDARLVALADPADGQLLRIAYRELAPAAPPDGVGPPVLLLLHGNPGRGADLLPLAERLSGSARVLVPDLPGFGGSTRRVGDYSVRAQGARVEGFLDALGVGRVHVVGFRMGGGVGLELAERERARPGRVASLIQVAAPGPVEFELLGDPQLNRLVHGLQLALVRAAGAGLPHFGALDRSPFDLAYARTFTDTDQRRLRPAAAAWQGPMLLVHGVRDALVPIGAAREMHRIVPQSELLELDESHFLQPEPLAAAIAGFVARVESGRATDRAGAAPERRLVARAPFDAARAGPQGVAGLLAFALLVLAASFVSEDLACIGVGLLVASGQVAFATGVGAAVLALWTGDFMLYGVGRLFGPVLLRRTPLRRALEAGPGPRSADPLRRSGPMVLLASRVVPGTRLPTYVAAGALRYPAGSFAFWLGLGALLWTPVLVGGAAGVGAFAVPRLDGLRGWTLPGAAALALALLVAARAAVQALTWRGRRLLVGRLRRLRHWEFWPRWAVYGPLVPAFAWLALRHRSLSVVTAVNPAIEGGGLAGESKARILEGLAAAAPQRVARFRFLPAGPPPAERAAAVRAFLAEHRLGYPAVLKPDVGERGREVAIVRSDAALALYLDEHPGDLIAQEYVPGREFGLFYVRRPGERHGRLFSITDKRMIAVTGDGQRTLEELILRDRRAVCLAPVHLARHAAELERVPASGEEVPLVELGSHSRGALFLDGSWLETPELAAAVDRVSRRYEGFYFGRYDVRSASVEELQKGRDFKVIELNGLTSEATHVYDPRHGVVDAWKVFYEQWRLAFAIGAENRRRGARVPTWRELWRLWRRRAA